MNSDKISEWVSSKNNPMVLNVKFDILTDSDARLLYRWISDSLNQGKDVLVDLTGCETCIPSKLSYALGLIYRDYKSFDKVAFHCSRYRGEQIKIMKEFHKEWKP